MTLRFDADDRKQIAAIVVVPTTVDPDTATLHLELGDTRYPCSWTDDAETSDGQWTREARTDAWFAGPSVPEADIGNAVVLDYGLHQPKLIVSNGSLAVSRPMASFTIGR